MSQKASKVEIIRYATGDAKWVFDPVNVSENTAYLLADSYMSNIASDVTVSIAFADGTHVFYPLASLAPSPTWQSYTRIFTTPV